MIQYKSHQLLDGISTNIRKVSWDCRESFVLLHLVLTTTLFDVRRTRWVERVDGLDVFQELFVAHAYAIISNKASFFFKLTPFDFIVSLVIARSVLD